MITGTVTVKSSCQGGVPLKKLLAEISKMRVYVGIPEESAEREDGGPLSNAQILFINTHGARGKSMRQEMQPALAAGQKYSAAHALYIQAHGSPLWHTPPRPVIEPAIEAEPANSDIAEELGLAAKATLDGNPDEAKRRLELAGQTGEDAARNWFDDPRNNWSANAPATIKAKGSDHPMIDTDELRKKISHVVGAE